MNKKSTLIVLLVAMVVLNIAMLAFMFFKGGKLPHQRGGTKANAKEFIQKEFGFNDQQMLEFDNSRIKHAGTILGLNKEIQEFSIRYYQLPGSEHQKDSLLQVVTDLSKSFYIANDIHIQEMRDLCSPDKQYALEGFIQAQISDRDKKGAGNRPPLKKK